MIKGITSSSDRHLSVFYGTGHLPTVYPNSSNPLQGMLRINVNNLEVFDGNAWLQVATPHADIALNADTMATLDWAKKKMDNEKRMLELAQTHPGVADAVAELTHAQQRVDIMVALTEQDRVA